MKNRPFKKRKLFYLVFAVLIIGVGIILALQSVLPKIEAAPDLRIERTAALLARGEYMANNVSVCMDCHSTRDWSQFSGPIKEGSLGQGGEYFGPEMGFPGTFYSRNITPASLGSWTDGEIFRAITTGVSRDGAVLFPVMPYHYYSKMDTEDVRAIIVYLRSLKSVENVIPKSEPDFPMNLIMKTFPKQYAPSERPSPHDKIALGAYLMNAASCMDCHSPVDKGKVILAQAFSGGREFGMPNGKLYSANITPDKATGIGLWTDSIFVARFKAYEDSSKLPQLRPDQMNTVMPWTMYAGMERSDLEAIFAYLNTIKPIANKVERYIP